MECGAGNIREELACMAQRRWNRNLAVTVANVVRFLFENGWIDTERAKRAVIKDFYYQMLSRNQGDAHESRLDCMANYEVSEGYVKHTVYECRDIK